MTLRHIWALFLYLASHEKHQCGLVFFLFAIGVFLIAIIHAQHPLPAQGIIAFFALWGFIQLPALANSITDDFRDGTFDYLVSEGYRIQGYALARLLVFCMLFSVPILLIQMIGCYAMSISCMLLCLLINHLHGLVSVIGVQIMLCLTTQPATKITSLFLCVPFWVPSFLYVIGAIDGLVVDSSTVSLPLIGLFCFQCGVTVVLIQNAFHWRS